MKEKHIVNLFSALIVGIGLLALSVCFAQWSNGPWGPPSTMWLNGIARWGADLEIQTDANQNVVFFGSPGTGENPYFAWRGRNSGDTANITGTLQGGDGTHDMNVMNCVQSGHWFKIQNGAVNASFERGTGDNDISCLMLENSDGEICYIYPNAAQNGIIVQAAHP